MADEAVLTPTEPSEPEPTDTQTSDAPSDEEARIGQLLETLNRAGVSSIDQLEGKLEASQQVGQMANLLGDARKRIEQLESAPSPAQVDPYTGNQSSDDLDLEGLMTKVIRKEDQRKNSAAMQRQQMINGAMQSIYQDEDFPLVKEVWAQKVQDPNFVMRVNSGQVNPVNEYTTMVRNFYKKNMRESAQTIESLQKGMGVSPPHVEGNAAIPAMKDKEAIEQTKLKQNQESVNKGKNLSEDEELDALANFFASPE